MGCRRGGAVRVDPDQLADPRAEVLDLLPVALPIALGDEQLAVAAEHQPGAEVAVAAHLRLLPVDHLHVLQAAFAQPSPRHCGARPALAGLRIGEVDQPALLEPGVERHVQQASLPLRRHLGHSGQRLREPAILLHQAEPAGALCDEHPAVGQERQRPGMLQALGHGLRADLPLDGPGLGRALGRAATGRLRLAPCHHRQHGQEREHRRSADHLSGSHP